jgi:hypothetical protein
MNAFAYEQIHNNLKRLKPLTLESLVDNYLEIAATRTGLPSKSVTIFLIRD